VVFPVVGRFKSTATLIKEGTWEMLWQRLQKEPGPRKRRKTKGKKIQKHRKFEAMNGSKAGHETLEKRNEIAARGQGGQCRGKEGESEAALSSNGSCRRSTGKSGEPRKQRWKGGKVI